MYCSKCGKEVSEGLRFCPFCGANLQQNQDTDSVKDDTMSSQTSGFSGDYKDAENNPGFAYDDVDEETKRMVKKQHLRRIILFLIWTAIYIYSSIRDGGFEANALEYFIVLAIGIVICLLRDRKIKKEL